MADDDAAAREAAIAKLQAAFRGGHVRDMMRDRVQPGQDLCPYVGTPDAVVDAMVRLAALGPDDVAYDLGCGDARIVQAAAAASGCRGVGVELDPILVRRARTRLDAAGLADRVEVREGDIGAVDLSEATAVLVFLTPNFLATLAPRFREQLRPGAVIVSYVFPVPGMEPVATEETLYHLGEDASRTSPVYKYVV